MGELESFRARERLDGAAGAHSHVVPIQWVPIFDQSVPDVAEAVRWGQDMPEYVELGLYGLCRFEALQPEYRQFVVKLADLISDVAADSPLTTTSPSLPLRRADTTDDAAFVVGVLSVSDDDVPLAPRTWERGEGGVRWQPFGRSEPLAEETGDIVESLSMTARIMDVRGNATSAEAAQIILVDPWVLATRTDRWQSRTPWSPCPMAVPIVVTDEADTPHAAESAEYGQQAVELLSAGVSTDPACARRR
jgi:hypothetical protein